jgi:3-oxoacyl-[acyl-carrier protein] reductase
MTTYTNETASRTAIVTGASGSVGQAIARRLAEDGLAVVVNYAHGEQEAHKTARQITAGGGTAIAAQANVADAGEFAALFAAAEQAFGGVDVLVNNAGVSRLGTIAGATDDDYDAIFDVSTRGTLHGLRMAASHLRDAGRVVNLSSTSLAATTPGLGLYMAAKAAVETLTRSAAKELAPRGITVNAIAPGAIASPMFFEGKTEEQIARVTQAHPAGRLGSVDEIAAVVSLLVTCDADWISGQVIRVNGGAA